MVDIEADRDDGRPGRRERNRQAKLGRIQDAAWKLFHEKGFTATTTREVAEVSGVAAGTVFLYARDKGELLVLAYDRMLTEAIDRAVASAPREAPTLARVLHVLDATWEIYERDQYLAREYVREWLRQEDHRPIGGDRQEPAPEPREGVGRRLLDFLTGEEPSLALACLGIYHAALVLWLNGWLRPGETADGYVRDMVNMVFGGGGDRHRSPVITGVAVATEPERQRRANPVCRPTIFGPGEDFVD